jgi:hypothetical protein
MTAAIGQPLRFVRSIVTLIALALVANGATASAAEQPDPPGRHLHTIIKNLAGAPFQLPVCTVIVTRATAGAAASVDRQYFRFNVSNASSKTLTSYTSLLIDADSSGRYITPSSTETTIINVTSPGPLQPGYVEHHIASTLPNAPRRAATVICEPENARFADGTSWTSHNEDARWSAEHH